MCIIGLLGTWLVGVVGGSLCHGAVLTVARNNSTDIGSPVISRWNNGWHGLEAVVQPRNLVLGIAVFFLARTLALLLFINRSGDDELTARSRRMLWYNAVPFVVFFVAFVVWTFLAEGYAVDGAVHV